MAEYVHYFNLTLGIFAIVLQFLCVFSLVLLFLVSDKNKFKNEFFSFVLKHFLFIGFIISFFSTALSLFYSEILGYAACFLCWLQRIFLFPQVVLFGMAYLKEDKKVAHYAFPLLFSGVNEIGGYISIPMFSLTMFLALITLLSVVRFYKKDRV
ncbi:MAG: putative disulfide formation protein [Candidatus Nomurabacteria bacterium GW2011_GWA1_36_15]|uniref:Putative disulfide formation protein n=1 Tax=Candidatus Nomurabacteria bacterium GW2011_GWA1_36_15 TaxID=1618728 RepID=A0A0G0E991_9BACT|nr:MAG: putative disulfide formation protein [Candidatus Nomurabacteria bacterium GW2011_GWA1_36_15]